MACKVVNDAPVKAFGYVGDSYWREVFCCQVSFDGTDEYFEVRKLKWNMPCVWTCNVDLDPRKDRDVNEYLKLSDCVIVNLGDSKLFLNYFIILFILCYCLRLDWAWTW